MLARIEGTLRTRLSVIDLGATYSLAAAAIDDLTKPEMSGRLSTFGRAFAIGMAETSTTGMPMLRRSAMRGGVGAQGESQIPRRRARDHLQADASGENEGLDGDPDRCEVSTARPTETCGSGSGRSAATPGRATDVEPVVDAEEDSIMSAWFALGERTYTQSLSRSAHARNVDDALKCMLFSRSLDSLPWPGCAW